MSNTSYGASSCLDCAVGTYSNTTGAENATFCILCPAGKYQNESGSRDCAECVDDSDSPLGSVNQSACACNSGFYGNGFTGCTACGPNSFSRAGSAHCTCDAGYQGLAGVDCQACLPGSSAPFYPRTSISLACTSTQSSNPSCQVTFTSLPTDPAIILKLNIGVLNTDFDDSNEYIESVEIGNPWEPQPPSSFSDLKSGGFDNRCDVMTAIMDSHVVSVDSTGELVVRLKASHAVGSKKCDGKTLSAQVTVTWENTKIDQCVSCAPGTYSNSKVWTFAGDVLQPFTVLYLDQHDNIMLSIAARCARVVGENACVVDEGYSIHVDTRNVDAADGDMGQAEPGILVHRSSDDLDSHGNDTDVLPFEWTVSVDHVGYTLALANAKEQHRYPAHIPWSFFSHVNISCGIQGQEDCEGAINLTQSQGSPSDRCVTCIAGKFQNVTSPDASTSQAHCLACPAHSVSGVGSTICECEKGWTPVWIQEFGWSRMECVACPAGKYKSTVGPQSCEACAAGKYASSEAQTSCNSCPNHQYQDLSQSTTCHSCAANAGRWGNSIMCFCNPGYEGDGMSGYTKVQARECDQNVSSLDKIYQTYDAYRRVYNATNNPGITAEQLVKYCGLACEHQAGGFTVSASGECLCEHMGVANTSAQACVLSGYERYEFNRRYAQLTAVVPMLRCRACEAGKYKTYHGTSSCVDCEIAKYQAAIASSKCLACEAGKYQSGPSSSSCLLCGNHSDSVSNRASCSCNAGYQGSFDASGGYYCSACGTGMVKARSDEQQALSFGFSSVDGAFIQNLVDESTLVRTTWRVDCHQSQDDDFCKSYIGDEEVANRDLLFHDAGLQPKTAGGCNWDDGVAVTIDLRRPTLITSIVRYLSGGSTRLHCNQNAALSMAGSFTGEEIEVFSCSSYSACFRDPLPGGGRTLTFPATTARFVRYYTSRSNVDPEVHITDLQVFGVKDRASKCLDCPVGHYVETTAALACTACAPGTYQDMPASTSCKSCAPPAQPIHDPYPSGTMFKFRVMKVRAGSTRRVNESAVSEIRLYDDNGVALKPTSLIRAGQASFVLSLSSPHKLSHYSWITATDDPSLDPVGWTLEARMWDSSWMIVHEFYGETSVIPSARGVIVGPFDVRLPGASSNSTVGRSACECPGGYAGEWRNISSADQTLDMNLAGSDAVAAAVPVVSTYMTTVCDACSAGTYTPYSFDTTQSAVCSSKTGLNTTVGVGRNDVGVDLKFTFQCSSEATVDFRALAMLQQRAVSAWSHCANERSTCFCPGSVRFGHKETSRWSIPHNVAGSIQCSNSIFGDPAYGAAKTCECNAHHTPTLQAVSNIGRDSCTSSAPCSVCKGDCDSDNDCQGSLKCFQRNGNDPGPQGCATSGKMEDWDYCYDPNFTGHGVNSIHLTVDNIQSVVWDMGNITNETSQQWMFSSPSTPKVQCSAGLHTLSITGVQRFELQTVEIVSDSSKWQFVVDETSSCEVRFESVPTAAISTVSIQVRSQLEQVGGCSDCQVHQVGYLASVVSHAANSSILLQDSPTLFTGFDCKFYSYIDEMRDGSQFTAFDQLTPQVSMTFSHLNWANKNDFGAISGLDTSRFGALITGYVYCHTSGQYEFKTSSDDGSWLWIDEAFVIENGGWHGMRERTGSLYLSAGYHWCRIQLFDSGGGAGLIVRYKGPDTNEVWTLLPGYNTGSEQASSSAVLLPPPRIQSTRS